MNRITETILAIHEWLAALSPQFAFLLALPFVVAAAGFAADALESSHHLHSSASR